ncbi:MAG TPA: M23 family metallopeptidase [Oceanospirillales bacterium]|nr:M23 family metallopeptidase [Oceanospirillales bacterium]
MKNIIVLKQTKSGTTSYNLSDNKIRQKIIALSVFSFVAIMMMGLGAGYLLFNKKVDTNANISEIQTLVQQKEEDLTKFKQRVTHDLDALALQIGGLYAQSMRINALGERLTEVAKLDTSEFNFETEPGVGGADLELTNEENTPQDLFANLYSIKANFKNQEQQLNLINNLLEAQDLDKQLKPSGKPIRNGWISSYYGTRTDPFTGKQAVHSGMDFAGKHGSIIQAVAEGVVIWSGKRGNYGNLVEIDHGEGYVTRYAHLSETKVKVGQKVEKAQEVGVMGQTGRATSEHLHFEVLKKGHKINPWTFLAKK